MLDISVAIPVFNEAENLFPLYEDVVQVLDKLNRCWELIFINDGSTDGSKEKLNQLADRDQRVKVVHLKRNYGQTAAIMAGFDFSQGEIIVLMDADLQNDPKDIPRLLKKLDGGYDVCSGWRKYRRDHPLRRNLLSRWANKLISKTSKIKLHDCGCTLKAYRRDVVKGLKLYGEMHRFIPIFAHWQGAKMAEITVKHHPRVHGHSKYGTNRIFKVLLDLIVVQFIVRFAEKPIYIFGGFGLISLALSALSALGALYFKFLGGKSFVQTPLPLLFVMTGITGVMCILMGLLAELSIRTYYESQGKPVYLVKETKNVGGHS